jgi:tRNA threonylcarbamoyladenosine modification (KEOPS) complex  Pcc1 subunit
MKEFRYQAQISMQKSNTKIKYAELISNQKTYKRSTIQFKEHPNSLKFIIKANDTTALRATINSILKEIYLIENVLKVKIPQNKKR